MRWLILFAMTGILFAAAPDASVGADKCQAFPAGSLSRMECERQEAARIRQEEQAKRKEQESNLGTTARGTTIDDFSCPSGSPSGVTFLSGAPGETVDGSFLNNFGKTAQDIRVSLELVDNQGRIVDRVSAAVFPSTLGPSEVGKFQLYLPHRNQLSRPWDCFRAIVTERPPEQIQVR
jgi:hypothetical protein